VTILGDHPTRVLLAILELRAGASVRDIARHLNLPPSTIWYQLRQLRDAQLITWTPHRVGTIRAAVEMVPA